MTEKKRSRKTMEMSCLTGAVLAVLAVLLLGAPAHATNLFIVTPWTAGPATDTLMTCTNCAGGEFSATGTQLQPVYLKNTGTGLYGVRFVGFAPSSTTKAAVHVTALGSPGVSCVPSSTGTINGDYTVGVTCRKGTVAVNSRFMLDVDRGSSSWTGPGRGFAALQFGALSTANSWSSSGQAPTFTRSAPGTYQFQFPGLTNTASGGNAQVVSTDPNKHCSLVRWGTGTTTTVDVKCYDVGNTVVDSDLYVMFTQQWGSSPSFGNAGFIWSTSASTSGTFTPSAFYDRGAGSASGGTPPAMTVNHYAQGRYLVDVGAYTALNGFASLTGVHAQVTAWGTTATCNVSDIDVYTVTVACSDANGAPADAVFSLLYGNDNTRFQRGFYQIPVTGTNYDALFDAGNGLICGTSPTQNGNIICVVPVAKSSTSEARPVGGGPPPGGTVKSVAVSNVDATSANVLVLGSDNVVYATSGKLQQAWDPTKNFVSWTTYTRAVDTTGAAVSLKKIISVRATSTNGSGVITIVGLTTAGKIMITHAAGETWAPYPPTGNPNDTFKDISHGRDDIYALKTDGTMIWSSFAGGFGGLPPLPNNLSVIAIGGRYAMSNAGLSSGQYPCTGPKDPLGNYNCAGSAQRVFRLEANRVWVPMLSSPMLTTAEPTVNQADVLTGGDPLATVSPTVVDAEAFEGNWGTFLVYQYFHRLYQLDP